jgi:hypothetical protein
MLASVVQAGPLNSKSERRPTELVPPAYVPFTREVEETTVRFSAYHNNEGEVRLEVWRARSSSTGDYVLIRSELAKEIGVVDAGLQPRTTYYYKFRAVSATDTSAFSSDIVVATTYSVNYPPDVEVFTGDTYDIDFAITDRSYNDVAYRLYLEGQSVAIDTWYALDSGTTYYTSSFLEVPAKVYNYYIEADVQGEGWPTIVIKQFSASRPINTPYFDSAPPPENLCGAKVLLQFVNPNDNLVTDIELYRATAESGPYSLIATLPDDTYYVDASVAPRKTYYYKLRAVNEYGASEFSEVVAKETATDWYEPTFTATVLADGTVDVTLVHNSYVNVVYSIGRLAANEDDLILTSNLETSDSGHVYTFHDTSVKAGKLYEYHLDGYQLPILCENWPGGDGDYNIAEVVVTTPADDYTISGFTLVDPVTNQDIGPLSNGALFEANLLPNIRANVGSKVKSVIFFLNNKRRTDNGPPLFTYWPAQNGDYDPGVWLPTTYNLKATAYSEKNGGGIAGTTLEINFQILASVHLDSLVLIDPVTNQPIRRLINFDTVDASLNANIRAYTSSNAKCVTFFLNNVRRTDNGPPVFTYFPLGTGGLSTPGQYLLKSTASTEKNGGGLVGYTFYTNFTVVCSTCATQALAAEDESNETKISLYPNPVVSASRLQINAPASSTVRAQLYDQFGSPIGSLIDTTIDTSGEYQLPMNELRLKKGTYIFVVKVDGTRTVKRFVVE